MSIASLEVSSPELSRAFGRTTVGRGRDYARHGRVLDHAWSSDASVLTGTCRGSGNHHYRQQVRFRGSPALSHIERTVCTCPMQTFCKHVAALLITAAGQNGAARPSAEPQSLPGLSLVQSIVSPTQAPAPAPPSWRAAVASILDGPAEEATAPSVKPLALAVGLSAPTRFSPRGSLTLRPMIMGARENWIKTGASWRDIAAGRRRSADPSQHAALRAIQRLLVGNTYAMTADTISLAAPPRAVWRLLSDAVADGVTLIADPVSLRSTTIRFGPASLHYAITEHPDGARIANELIVDGNPLDPRSVDIIGSPEAHGLWAVDDGVLTLAPLDRQIQRDEMQTLRSGGDIIIPTADLPEFSLEALPRLTQRRTVRVDDGLLAPPTIEGPEAV
ncbi:SWIM zinc finger family protein, partial [Gordonia rhizosphera]